MGGLGLTLRAPSGMSAIRRSELNISILSYNFVMFRMSGCATVCARIQFEGPRACVESVLLCV